MAPPPLPPHIVSFVRSHIHSVAQLEVLLFLRERRGGWSPRAVAEELRITPESAKVRLKDLEVRGLVRYDLMEDAYTYEPKTKRMVTLIDGLAASYRTMRYTVIDLIFSVPGDAARTLAEALHFKKRKRD